MDKFKFTITADLPVDADVDVVIGQIGKEGVLEYNESDLFETINGLTDLSNVQVSGVYLEQSEEPAENKMEDKILRYAALYLQENIEYISRQLQFSHFLPEQKREREAQLAELKSDLALLTPQLVAVGLATPLESDIEKGNFH